MFSEFDNDDVSSQGENFFLSVITGSISFEMGNRILSYLYWKTEIKNDFTDFFALVLWRSESG